MAAPQTENSQVNNQPIPPDKANPRWWSQNMSEVPPDMKDILENYSNIPPEQVLPRLFAFREKAWTFGKRPYPCIGRFRFLDLGLRSMDEYPEVVERVKGGEKILDLGCCFGQELRGLFKDTGVEVSGHTYASDLVGEYWESSFELFNDKHKISTTFLAGDIFDESDGPQNGLKKFEEVGMDIVYAGSFLHLFDWDGQVKACKRIVKILEAKPGVMFLGRQTGLLQAREVSRQIAEGESFTLFAHNVETFKKMWEQIGEETGTKWKVDAKIDVGETFQLPPAETQYSDRRRVRFCARRL